MNIAEIRKKGKKKKEEKPDIKELLEEKEQDKSVSLPVPAGQDIEKEDTTGNETIDFIDEENLYKKYSLKETKDLKEFLCFRIGEEEYALHVSFVKEIIKNRPLTEVPKTIDFILGVISIRGEVLPVFDLKKLLDIPLTAISINSKIIIIDNNGEKVGLVVDGVTQILKISQDEIEETPMNISGAKKEFIKGITMKDNKMVRILDMEKILAF